MQKLPIIVGILLLVSLACFSPVNIIVEQPNQAVTAEIVIVTSTPATLTQIEPTPEMLQTVNPVTTQDLLLPVTGLDVTQTPSKVTVTVSQNTNCRVGPGMQFNTTGQLLISQTAEVVGKNTSTNYWIINNPNGSGSCWLWGYYATISGDPTKLQEIASPPTPIPPTPTKIVNQPPIINEITLTNNRSSSGLIIYSNIAFYDVDGDAFKIEYKLIDITPFFPVTIRNGTLTPSSEQKTGSVITGKWTCGNRLYELTLEARIYDEAGHISAPYLYKLVCN